MYMPPSSIMIIYLAKSLFVSKGTSFFSKKLLKGKYESKVSRFLKVIFLKDSGGVVLNKTLYSTLVQILT